MFDFFSFDDIAEKAIAIAVSIFAIGFAVAIVHSALIAG